MKTSLLRKAKHRSNSDIGLLLFIDKIGSYDNFMSMDRYMTLRYARTYYKRYAWVRWTTYELKWQVIAIYYMLIFRSVTSYPRWFEIFLGVFGWICVFLMFSGLWIRWICNLLK